METTLLRAVPSWTPPKCEFEDEPEARILTQKEVIEQISSHISPLTKQLEDLTELIKGMSTSQQPIITQGEVPVLVLVHPDIRLTIYFLDFWTN